LNNSAVNLIFSTHGPDYEAPISGGAVRELEIMKRLSREQNIELSVVAPRNVCSRFQSNGIKANYNVIPCFIKGRNSLRLFLDSMLRSIYVSFLSFSFKDRVLIYSPSDFFYDSLPAFIWKLRNKKAKWIVCIFLVVPSLFRDYTKTFSKDNKFSIPTFSHLCYFFSQQLTISLAKKFADKILVLNSLDRIQLIKERGLDGLKISVVNGGIEYRHIESLKVDQKIYDGVFLGRFHPQKGIFDLIKIWKLVSNKQPNAKLCIIGGGDVSSMEQVQALIQENNLSNNIKLVGPKLNDEKFLFLKSSSIFLCPSYYESFAIVIAEAMACGLPVVAYDLPIYKDIYNKNILTIPLGDIDQFADAIIKFLKNEKLGLSFGLEGKKFIQKYDWDEIAKKEYGLIIEAISKR
jgi:glycosyltransferase involved in cell wall biosynthesis